MRQRLSIAALLVVALMLSQTAIATQQVELKWQFVEGETITYLMTMNNETEMPGGMGVAVVDNIATTSWHVLEVNDAGEARVRISNDRIQMRMQSAMGNMEYDSDEPSAASDPMLAAAGAVVGTSYILTFDESGKVSAVEGLEEMRAAMTENSQSNPAVEQVMDQFASEDGILNSMRQGMAALPDGPVAPGDSWDSNFSMELPMLGTLANSSTMTLDRVEDRDGGQVAVVKNTGSIDITMDESSGNPMAGMMEMGTSAIIGSMEWDVERGRFISSAQTMTMEMNVSAGGQEMSILTVMNMTMEVIDSQ